MYMCLCGVYMCGVVVCVCVCVCVCVRACVCVCLLFEIKVLDHSRLLS